MDGSIRDNNSKDDDNDNDSDNDNDNDKNNDKKVIVTTIEMIMEATKASINPPLSCINLPFIHHKRTDESSIHWHEVKCCVVLTFIGEG